MLSIYSGLSYMRLDQNLGFAPAVNIGIKSARGEVIVILNNDTLVSPNWLSYLMKCLEENPSIGILSPVTNYVGEGLQIDPDAKNIPPELNLISQYANNISGRYEILYVPIRLVFFCVAIRREVLDKIGVLDESFERGNFEDDDFCLRTRLAGYKLAILRNSFVYHKGSVTFQVNQIDHARWFEANRTRFYVKCGRLATSVPYLNTQKDCDSGDRINVIVRTKDRPYLLERALLSLANQTYKNFEVLLVNDGEIDVENIYKTFSTIFPIMHFHNRVPLGRTGAINAGLRKASAKWVAYLDDDDIIYPWHFETMMQAVNMDKSTFKVYYSNYNRALFENSKSKIPIQIFSVPSWDFDLDQLLVNNFLPIHTYIHSRDCIDTIGFWDETLDRLEDYDFLLRLATAFSKFRHVDNVTAEYRIYKDIDNSITGDGRRKYLNALRAIYNKHPVKDERIHEFRENTIVRLENQVTEIERVYQLYSVSEARYHAIKTVFGI
jgi:GT2 family glycosyltransferase